MTKNPFQIAIFSSAFLGALAAFGAPKSQKPAAIAELMNAQGQKVGTAQFISAGAGVKLMVQVHGLTPGNKGIHIHETGQCTGPDFKSAGGHLNPDKKHHGLDNPAGHHEGDMANLNVSAGGSAQQEFDLTGVELTGSAPHSLFKAGGTAIVIHAEQDDEKSDPAGNAGGRIACGVIRKP